MPTYKLTYFNFKGRGELMRLIFAAACQQFTDERIEMQDWPDIKPSAHIPSSRYWHATVALYIPHVAATYLQLGNSLS